MSDLPIEFGRYRVKRKLGSGAMGAVYLAQDTLLDREVALKTPIFEDDDDGELLKRFYREARAVSKIKHQNLCAVYDVGEIEGRHYISMEFVPGRKLSDFIKPDKPMTEKQAMAVIRRIALAMQEAHSHDVIHRDLKPDNIMINNRGEPVVMDFGLVHKINSDASSQITQRGSIVGSPAYMSKEQVEGNLDALTEATDQYSLGVILYQLLTSRRPFEGGLHAVLGAILTRDPLPPRRHRPGLNPQLEAVCLKMMSKRAIDRYPSMKAVADALAEVARQSSGASMASATILATRDAASELLEDDSSGTLVEKPSSTDQDLESVFKTWPLLESPVVSLNQSLASRRRSWVFGAALILAALVVAAFVWPPRRDATVSMEILDDGIVVTLQNESFRQAGAVQSVALKPGAYHLHVKAGDVEFETEPLLIHPGAKPRVAVRKVESRIVVKAHAGTGDAAGDFETVLADVDIASTPALRPSTRLPTGRWIDLLEMVRIPDHAVLGHWSVVDRKLVSEATLRGRVMVPVVAAGGYELSCKFLRRSGKEAVTLIIPVGDSGCAVMIDGWTSTLSGIYLVDRKNPPNLAGTDAVVNRTSLLTNDTVHELAVKVSVDEPFANVQVTLDQSELISWRGRFANLIPPDHYCLPIRHTFGVCTYNSIVEVEEFKLRLEEGQEAYQLGDDWRNPLFAVADEPEPTVLPSCLDWKGQKYFFSGIPLSLSDAHSLATRLKGRLLTISSAEEEQFILEQGKGKMIWTSGWRPLSFTSATQGWRDDRNRPIRYLGKWAPNQPDNGAAGTPGDQFKLEIGTAGHVLTGWDDAPSWLAGSYACIEWGDEYASREVSGKEIKEQPDSTNEDVTNGDFSQGLQGWIIEGGATNFRLFRDRTFQDGNQVGLSTFGANRGDDTGRLSQSFKVPGNARALEWYLHGFHPPNNRVALLLDGEIYYRSTNAPNNNTPVRIEWDLRPLRGKKVTLEIVDLEVGEWRYFGTHAFKILREN